MATEGVEGCAHAQPEVAQYPIVVFHRKLATGSDVIFPRAFFLVVVQNVGLGVLYDVRVYPFPLLSAPFIFILSLLFSDMLCSTPRMVFLRVK